MRLEPGIFYHMSHLTPNPRGITFNQPEMPSGVVVAHVTLDHVTLVRIQARQPTPSRSLSSGLFQNVATHVATRLTMSSVPHPFLLLHQPSGLAKRGYKYRR